MPSCVDESTNIEIRFNSQAAETVSPDELALIETILPDLINLMHELDEQEDIE